MALNEKIANAKTTNWITEGLSEEEIKSTVELAKISAQIERRRLDMGMTQKEFAKFMGVSQGMISRWESREYNFTVKTLVDICEKTGLSLSVSMHKLYYQPNYVVLPWEKERTQKNNLLKLLSDGKIREAIA